jgi:hypothetical protein
MRERNASIQEAADCIGVVSKQPMVRFLKDKSHYLPGARPSIVMSRFISRVSLIGLVETWSGHSNIPGIFEQATLLPYSLGW